MFEKILKRLKRKKELKKGVDIKDLGINNVIEVDKSAFRGRMISICVEGDNNTIKIADTSKIEDTLVINLYADNSEITIGKGFRTLSPVQIMYGINRPNFYKTDNISLKIGDNVSVGDCKFFTFEKDSSISIGDDCMISGAVNIFNTDGHSIYDMDGNLINKAHSITVGKHCWVGSDVTILKNISIADDTIIAMKSMVTKSCDESNVILAGTPAKIVKRGVKWDEKNYPSR